MSSVLKGSTVESLLEPCEPAVLASAVVDTLAVAADPRSREASIFYWERGRTMALAVVEAIGRVEDTRTRELAAALSADPANPSVFHELRGRLVELQAEATGRDALDELFARAWLSESNSRLGYHLGTRYQPSGAAPDAGQLATLAPGRLNKNPDAAEVLVVIPFRDRGEHAHRLRNLLACLHALADQSAPRDGYQVVVVESDDFPRHRATIEPLADRYVFAEKSGSFNKSWAVNVGVVGAPAAARVVCVLDADVLADREFIARNAARFRRPGAMGHLSYRNMWCLDEAATGAALEERLSTRVPHVPFDRLRAFVLRRPPGCCVWSRLSAYHRIGGMDERFEGWGGEDNDFLYRMDVNSAFDSYDDPLLHLYHPSSAVLLENGDIVNAHIPALSWPADAPIGDPARFAARIPAEVPR
jgi:hypothetical protein